jgi:selenide,water dikinase
MEMADASSVRLNFEFTSIPFVSCARKYAEMGCIAGGAYDNQKYFGADVQFADSIDAVNQMLLFDPQTSGGLLLGVPQEKLETFITRAKELSQSVWVVGKTQPGSGIQVSK